MGKAEGNVAGEQIEGRSMDLEGEAWTWREMHGLGRRSIELGSLCNVHSEVRNSLGSQSMTQACAILDGITPVKIVVKEKVRGKENLN